MQCEQESTENSAAVHLAPPSVAVTAMHVEGGSAVRSPPHLFARHGQLAALWCTAERHPQASRKRATPKVARSARPCWRVQAAAGFAQLVCIGMG